MKRRYILRSLVTMEFNGVDGKPTRDLNKVDLFTKKHVFQYAAVFAPNFEFVEVLVEEGKTPVLVNA